MYSCLEVDLVFNKILYSKVHNFTTKLSEIVEVVSRLEVNFWYPLTSQEILKYFSDGFLKNPMCQVTLLNLSTGICSNPRLIALYYRNRVELGKEREVSVV